MHNYLIDKFPDDILNNIFRYIKPLYKYSLTKSYFNKYYHIRFGILNIKNLYFQKVLNEWYIITNFKYIKFIIKNDIYLVLSNIINYKLKNDSSNYILKKPIVFENTKYINFIDFCYLLCLKFNSLQILDYINKIIILKNFINFKLRC